MAKSLTPTNNDVLFSKSLPEHDHPGNQFYEDLILANLDCYSMSKSGKDQLEVAVSIVSTIKEKGARFLQQNSSDGYWSCMSEAAVLKETKDKLERLHINAKKTNEKKIDSQMLEKENNVIVAVDTSMKQYFEHPEHKKNVINDTSKVRSSKEMTRKSLVSIMSELTFNDDNSCDEDMQFSPRSSFASGVTADMENIASSFRDPCPSCHRPVQAAKCSCKTSNSLLRASRVYSISGNSFMSIPDCSNAMDVLAMSYLDDDRHQK